MGTLDLNNTELDILVIGAGQAGLAMGFHLRNTPLRFQMIDGHVRVGDSWRKRYDSLKLFTPRMYSALPGMPLSGDPLGYAGRDEFADYLEMYASHFQLPVVFNTTIQKLQRLDGHFQASIDSGQVIRSRVVVLATGAFQRPNVPDISRKFSPEINQYTTVNYRTPAQIPEGTAVLVVGDGATGRDIAWELADHHQVFLAAGRPRRLLPDRILGRSAWWWFDKIGLLRLSAANPLGQYLQRSDPFPGRNKTFNQLLARGVNVMPRLIAVEGGQITFSNNISAKVASVVWATGYRDHGDWVDIPAVKDGRGQFIHREGISPVDGLYFIGRPWQRNRGSALITGVGADASTLLAQINRRHFFGEG